MAIWADVLVKNKKVVGGIALGQLLSLIITFTGIFSQLLSIDHHFDAPTAQSALNYLLLIFYVVPFFILKRRWSQPERFVSVLPDSPYAVMNGVTREDGEDGAPSDAIKFSRRKLMMMVCLAFVDVEANYFAVKAYQFTSITSVMILDCLTIPFVMFASRIVLGVIPNRNQIIGVLIALIGSVILIVTDVLENEVSAGSKPWLGDVLCVVASMLYAVTNVGQEFYMKNYGPEEGIGTPSKYLLRVRELVRMEWLYTVGFFGFLVSSIQLAILERDEISNLSVKGGTPVILIILFALCLFALYSLVPYMMIVASATMFNLSLLTADVFAVIASYFIFGNKLSPLYFVSLVVTMIGLIIYNLPVSVNPKYTLIQPPNDPNDSFRNTNRS
ncbi:hypothetical protein PROFUN_02046 [Planoprotostelium fungivorum]|uniref:Uncharacterized protein n=1 Tax=Planoprotostelium fungivorum TaxID=1890364 RepID=A0A2P6NB80_9EUKA|nr:hypothetical protein PROFUN_02046 [Planoprotostelium fungivorum]